MSGDGSGAAGRASELLSISVAAAEDRVEVALKGELDAATSPKLTEVITDAIGKPGVIHLVLDLADLRFLDSAGLRVIIRARNELHARSGGSVRIVNADGVVARVLEITGIDQVLSDP